MLVLLLTNTKALAYLSRVKRIASNGLILVARLVEIGFEVRELLWVYRLK